MPRYSIEAGRETIEERIQEVEEEIKELTGNIEQVSKVSTSLIIRRHQKEQELENLRKRQNKKTTQAVLGQDNEELKKADAEISKVARSIKGKEQTLEKIMGKKQISHQELLKAMSLPEELERLKKKQGVLEAKQRKVVSSMLASELKNIHKESLAQGRRSGLSEIKETTKAQIIQNQEQIQKSKEENPGLKGVKERNKLRKSNLVSYRKLGMTTVYSQILQIKDGFAKGARKLPETIKNKVKEVYHKFMEFRQQRKEQRAQQQASQPARSM